MPATKRRTPVCPGAGPDIPLTRVLLAQVINVLDGMEPHTGELWQVAASAEALEGLSTQLREALQAPPPCKTDPRAPHGFLRNASHGADRYVCECECWVPPADEAPARWPVNAAEVRALLSGHVAAERYARDDHEPDDDDHYTLSAHDLLGAIEWWVDGAPEDQSEALAAKDRELQQLREERNALQRRIAELESGRSQ